MIEQGIDVDGRDEWDGTWWNGCENKGYLRNIWLEEMIWWIERNERNRELLLKIEGMKEMDVKNDVSHKGGWMNEGMNMMNTK